MCARANPASLLISRMAVPGLYFMAYNQKPRGSEVSLSERTASANHRTETM
jgi:hypothetical protein